MGNEKSALIYAAASGHTETVRMLENMGENVGADIHKTTQDEIELVSPVAGQASVLKAEYTETKRVERVVQEKNGVKEAAATTLKDVGADVNTPDVLNYTPIMVASELGDVKMVTTLAKPGANVTQQDGEGEIILTGAAEHALLIRMTTDENEKSALIYAAASGHTETVRMLENSGADIHKKENETTQDEIELVSPVAGQAPVKAAITEYRETETKRVERV